MTVYLKCSLCKRCANVRCVYWEYTRFVQQMHCNSQPRYYGVKNTRKEQGLSASTSAFGKLLAAKASTSNAT